MAEAKWLAADEVPSAEDYLRNGAVTSGLPLVFAHVLVLLDVDAVKKLADDHHIPRPVSCAAKILMLHNDMARAKEEEEGLDGSYRDLYPLENPSCDAEEHMLCLIAREWEELNRECLGRRRRSSTQACLNAARMISVMYGYNKEQRLPVLEDYIRTFLL